MAERRTGPSPAEAGRAYSHSPDPAPPAASSAARRLHLLLLLLTHFRFAPARRPPAGAAGSRSPDLQPRSLAGDDGRTTTPSGHRAGVLHHFRLLPFPPLVPRRGRGFRRGGVGLRSLGGKWRRRPSLGRGAGRPPPSLPGVGRAFSRTARRFPRPGRGARPQSSRSLEARLAAPSHPGPGSIGRGPEEAEAPGSPRLVVAARFFPPALGRLQLPRTQLPATGSGWVQGPAGAWGGWPG